MFFLFSYKNLSAVKKKILRSCLLLFTANGDRSSSSNSGIRDHHRLLLPSRNLLLTALFLFLLLFIFITVFIIYFNGFPLCLTKLPPRLFRFLVRLHHHFFIFYQLSIISIVDRGAHGKTQWTKLNLLLLLFYCILWIIDFNFFFFFFCQLHLLNCYGLPKVEEE